MPAASRRRAVQRRDRRRAPQAPPSRSHSASVLQLRHPHDDQSRQNDQPATTTTSTRSFRRTSNRPMAVPPHVTRRHSSPRVYHIVGGVQAQRSPGRPTASRDGEVITCERHSISQSRASASHNKRTVVATAGTEHSRLRHHRTLQRLGTTSLLGTFKTHPKFISVEGEQFFLDPLFTSGSSAEHWTRCSQTARRRYVVKGDGRLHGRHAIHRPTRP